MAREMDFDWNRVKVFLATVDEGSLSAAARALGSSQPTVGRQLDALEKELGVVLFERVGRNLRLTPSGERLLDDVRRMSEAAQQLARIASGHSQSIEGPISITASEVEATFVLPDIVTRLRAELPGLEVELVATNSARDLRTREADIALRNYRPEHPNLIAKKICELRARLYATPALLEAHGAPEGFDRLTDLEGLPFVGFSHRYELKDGLVSLGLDVSEDNFVVLCEQQLVQWALVKAGAGVGLMQEDVGDAEPAVRRAFPDLPPFPFPIWLTAHRELATSRRVRVVFDFLCAELERWSQAQP